VPYRLFYFAYRLATGAWYRVRRRLTLAGLSAAGGLCLVAGFGSDVQNNVLYEAFSVLLSLLVLAFGLSRFWRARFTAKRHLPRLGSVGHPLYYRVEIKNLGGKSQESLTLLEDIEDARPSYQDWLAFQLIESRRVRPFGINQRRRLQPFRQANSKIVDMPPIPKNGEVDVSMELLPLRRGIVRFKGLTIARPDPLGLFRSFIRLEAPQTVLILPRRYPLPMVALPGSMKYQEGGVALAANVGRSEEFVSLREYRYGDPLRNIHWRSWARVGKPIVKEFEDEFFVRHALILDTFNREPYSEVLEAAVSVAASFACTVLTQESLLDLLFVGAQSYCFTAGRGLGQADQMLEILASVRHCPDKKFDTLEQLVMNHVSAVSGCICVLQSWDEARRSLLNKLKVLGVPVLALVILPVGGKIPGDVESMLAPTLRIHFLEVEKIEEGLRQL
jgi:hypothetical protein